ncbi:uncharacterized protein F5Z01DRAFT_687367 [Emericellopsis atlantica]|uniref:Uncharacterized protein n=1 Tax=Emericellopsis atlantica TaxID=2614577 RepID=A0A9P7ZMZ7_9HYPO|nr:uncharacterized protein F5Z01DRAFT_687367 [Emericellopsis atlantica]KAG9254540.1 hypothetical protein F5Z01DRAFT_687367 [Emericellopsis atlantica]
MMTTATTMMQYHFSRRGPCLKTSGFTSLATRIGNAFIEVSDADPENDYLNDLGRWVRGEPSAAAQYLSRLIRSGLVAYTNDPPLYILAGKSTRQFSVDVDAYWAFLGALEMTTVVPWYNDVDLDRVRDYFFSHLLKRHQWCLILTPYVADNAGPMDLRWSQKFSDRFYLPLGVLFDVHWKQGLPHLPWASAEMEGGLDTIHLTAETGLPFSFVRVTKSEAGFWRRFEQEEFDPKGGAVIVTPVTKMAEAPNLFLPIADLGKRLDIPGMRCIEIEPADPRTPQAREHPGRVGKFKGVTDLWATPSALEEVHFTKYSLYARLG